MIIRRRCGGGKTVSRLKTRGLHRGIALGQILPGRRPAEKHFAIWCHLNTRSRPPAAGIGLVRTGENDDDAVRIDQSCRGSSTRGPRVDDTSAPQEWSADRTKSLPNRYLSRPCRHAAPTFFAVPALPEVRMGKLALWAAVAGKLMAERSGVPGGETGEDEAVNDDES